MFMSNISHNFDLSFGNPPVQQVNKVGSHHSRIITQAQISYSFLKLEISRNTNLYSIIFWKYLCNPGLGAIKI